METLRETGPAPRDPLKTGSQKHNQEAQEQVESGSNRDCERDGVWGGPDCLCGAPAGAVLSGGQRYVHIMHACGHVSCIVHAHFIQHHV